MVHGCDSVSWMPMMHEITCTSQGYACPAWSGISNFAAWGWRTTLERNWWKRVVRWCNSSRALRHLRLLSPPATSCMPESFFFFFFQGYWRGTQSTRNSEPRWAGEYVVRSLWGITTWSELFVPLPLMLLSSPRGPQCFLRASLSRLDVGLFLAGGTCCTFLPK